MKCFNCSSIMVCSDIRGGGGYVAWTCPVCGSLHAVGYEMVMDKE